MIGRKIKEKEKEGKEGGRREGWKGRKAMSITVHLLSGTTWH